MTLILFAQSLIGHVFGFRILQNFGARSLLHTKFLTKIGTGLFLLLVFLTVLLKNHPRAHILVIIFILSAFYGVMLLCERQMITKYAQRVPIFLDKWILNLKLGMGPKSAREAALRLEEEKFVRLIQAFFAANEVSANRTQHLFLLPTVARELAQIHRHEHAILARLQNLRQLVRQSDNFRRKSGQATRQMQIQSVVMLALHFALCGFVMMSKGWSTNLDIIALATLFSLTGAAIMTRIARKTKWKV